MANNQCYKNFFSLIINEKEVWSYYGGVTIYTQINIEVTEVIFDC